MSRSLYRLMLVGLLTSVVAATARAQVFAPSTYSTNIQVQAEPEGTEFDDWAAIPVASMDAVDNPGDLDIANIQIANDEQFIYIRASLHNTAAISLANLFLAFDTDQTRATGFDIFQIGEIGSELGYQTDFPFAQHESSYNLNVSLTGGPLNNGGALIFPFWTEAGAPSGNDFEWAVPRDAVIQYPPALGGPAPAFPNQTFDFAVYTTNGLGDLSDVITYTLAEAPAGSPGDFDLDEDVDGADLLLWQRGLGGDFDANDLADWQANFGAGPSAIAAIPEPSTIALVAIASLAVVRRRK
ncbi:MAG TPA: PEP-CTERM sorting domain-containing protein [Lacipirellula sp.]